MMGDRLNGSQEMVPITALIVDHRYQRPRIERQIGRISASFDPDLFSELTVSKRMDGVYAILDGQQRYWSLLAMGWDKTNQRIPCIVLDGLTPEREAEIFEGINENRVKVNSYDDWKSRIYRGESTALQIAQVCQSVGLTIANRATAVQPYEISCIVTLERMWQHVGNDNLARILRILKQGLPEDVLTNPLVHGMTMFVMEYHDQIKDGLMVKRLNTTTADQLVRRAVTLKNGHMGSQTMFVAYTLLDLYNHKQAAENRLPEHTPSAFAIVLREWDGGERRKAAPGQKTNVRLTPAGGKRDETPEQMKARMARVRSFRKSFQDAVPESNGIVPESVQQVRELFDARKLNKTQAIKKVQELVVVGRATKKAVTLARAWTR